MKNKILTIIMVMALSLTFCACGGDSKATITANDGTVNDMSVKELYDISTANLAQFSRYYSGALISFQGTLEKVEVDYLRSSSWGGNVAALWFEGGWIVLMDRSNSAFCNSTDLADLDKGTKLNVSGAIVSCFDLGGDAYVEIAEGSIEIV